MQWRDEGIILGVRKHGESNVILEMMTRGHGRHLGVVRGGRGKRQTPMLQPGNSLSAVWQARLDEHLGNYSVEPLALRAGRLIDNAAALYGLATVAAHLRLLPEREPHPGLFDAFQVIVDHIETPDVTAALIVRFELALLTDLGFGLDLKSCAATGACDDLIYVSPKSGRAVSREAGEPYHAKLLALPRFVSSAPEGGATRAEIADGMALTGYFLDRNLFAPRGLEMPEARASLMRAVG